MNFCCNCKSFFAAKPRPICLNPKAITPGSNYHVMGVLGPGDHYSCSDMRAGICRDGKYFVPIENVEAQA